MSAAARTLCRWFCGVAILWSLAAAARADGHVLVLGRMSDDPQAHYEQLRPLLDYVVPRMRDVGITEGRILMARDPAQMVSYLRRGRVDWVTETAASAMLFERRAGARPLLLTERSGVSRYRTLFFVRNDSAVRTLEDLRGRSVAFQRPASTSAYFVPAHELLARGLQLEVLLSPRDAPSDNSVGYVFGRSENNLSHWVHKRLVDAAAMSDLDWARTGAVPDSLRSDLRIVHVTQAFPRALEMVRGDLDPAVAARLRQVLLEASADPAARQALRHFFGTTRFIEIGAEDEAGLDFMRGVVERVGREVE